jgi:uncharacterized protein
MQANDLTGTARRWLSALVGGEPGRWPSLATDDVKMTMPFAPPGIPTACEGRDACEALTKSFFAGVKKFDWHEVQWYPAMEPNLLFGTAKSEALLGSGKTYRNDYCFIIRFRDGRVAEYREYFNPLPAIAAFTA